MGELSQPDFSTERICFKTQLRRRVRRTRAWHAGRAWKSAWFYTWMWQRINFPENLKQQEERAVLAKRGQGPLCWPPSPMCRIVMVCVYPQGLGVPSCDFRKNVTSMCFCFLICKMSIITLATSLGCCEDFKMHIGQHSGFVYVKHLEWCLAVF